MTQEWLRFCRLLGPVNYLSYQLQKRRGRNPVHLQLAGNSQGGLYMRDNHSDAFIFSQVFLNRDYGFVQYPRDVSVVVDAGANVGYASRYFLSRFPGCRVIAIEPDHENAEMIRKNVAALAAQVVVEEAALWHESRRMNLVRESREGVHFSGSACAFFVEEGTASEGDVQAVSLPQLMQKHRLSRIDVLKIDIEGAEAAIFRHPISEWIGQVGILIIEIHQGCHATVHRALEPYAKRHETKGELTVFYLKS